MGNKRLIYGFHALNARLAHSPSSLLEIYCVQNRHDTRMQALYDRAAQVGIKICVVDKPYLNTLTNDARHQGVAAWVDVSATYTSLDEVLGQLSEPPLLLILDGITDPHNLGACLRVADAMGVHAVIAPKDRSASVTAAVSKVACGAAEVIPYLRVTNLARTLRELKQQGIWVVGTTIEAEKSLFQFEQTGPLAWVLGSEGEGMRRLTRELCDIEVTIPMFGSVESMNVSVSTGIVLAESRRQRLAHAS